MAGLTPDSRLNRLISQYDPRIRRAFLEAIRQHKRSINLADLADALERNDLPGALEMLRIRDQMLYPLSESIRSAYIAGGLLAGEKLPITLRAQFGFGSNPRAETAAQAITGKLIEGVQADNLQAMRDTIGEAVDQGIPPAKLATLITG